MQKAENHRTKRPFKKANIIVALLLLPFLFMTVWRVSLFVGSAVFINRWVDMLSKCHSANDVNSLPHTDQFEPILIRDFSGGEWIAVCAYFPDDELADRAAVFHDSRGRTYSCRSGVPDCYEELVGQLPDDASLDSFYRDIYRMHLHREK